MKNVRSSISIFVNFEKFESGSISDPRSQIPDPMDHRPTFFSLKGKIFPTRPRIIFYWNNFSSSGSFRGFQYFPSKTAANQSVAMGNTILISNMIGCNAPQHNRTCLGLVCTRMKAANRHL